MTATASRGVAGGEAVGAAVLVGRIVKAVVQGTGAVCVRSDPHLRTSTRLLFRSGVEFRSGLLVTCRALIAVAYMLRAPLLLRLLLQLLERLSRGRQVGEVGSTASGGPDCRGRAGLAQPALRGPQGCTFNGSSRRWRPRMLRGRRARLRHAHRR